MTLEIAGVQEADGRAATSPENGKKGGRPPAPPPHITAEQFMLSALVDKAGNRTARHWRDGWHVYSPTGWTPTTDGEMEKTLISWMHGRGDELARHATVSYARNVLANLSAFNLCGVPVSTPFPSWLSTGEDARNWMAFNNGVCVDVMGFAKSVADGKEAPIESIVRDVSADFFSTDFVSYGFNDQAGPPELFIAYLRRVCPDPESYAAVVRMLGLMMVDCSKYEVFFQLYGKGANGKTVLLDIIEALVGRQNTSRVSLESLAPGTRFQSFPLVTAKVNISGELRTDIGAGNLASIEGEFKHAVSGGTIEVERKGVDKAYGRCRARFVMASNSLPTFVDKSDAIWRRLRIIPFDVQIPEAERDADLASKIIASEMPQIARLAIDGLAQVIQAGRVAECELGAAMKANHRASCDHEREFLVGRYEKAGPESKLGGHEIYEAYKSWIVANGYRPLGAAKFFQRVEDVITTARYGTVRLDGTPQKGLTGIKHFVTDVTSLELGI